MYYGVVEVKSGGEWRNITGRKNRPDRCMKIELPINFKVPYEVLRADNTTTGYARYTKITNYTSNALNPWRGYEVLTKGHTGPWSYTEDRQIATVDYMLLSQGHYVCANGGNCTAPDVCECAPGWMGFDCRTPVCNQGYYFPKQKRSVSGRETQSEIYDFNRFMQNNTRRQWPYANPKYTMQWETYVPAEFPEEHTTEIEVREHGNVSYLGQELWYANGFSYVAQGGYRCSIRAVTLWENYSTVFVQPNYYSRYMDYKVQADGKAYTHWSLMHWPPLHQKSPILDQTIFNRTYVYTNEGWRRNGVWSGTGSNWEYGTCIMEFYRRCPGGAHKQYDLEAKRANVYVQDVDVAYRPRVQYSDTQVTSVGRWDNFGGECVDEVVRGCYNNGTCIAPNTCECSIGWSGFDCTTPICTQTCQHNGNCTAPDTCTCQQGWEGFDCSIPLCSQECNNGGTCIAPDTCECSQFESEFRDYRVGGGQPLFKLQNGNPRKTGWTGFDCSVPICVQAQKFVLNSPTTSSNYGGRGADDLLQCTNAKGVENPRCPQFDTKVTTNDGRSFQTGCGWDPLDTGCCVVDTSDPNKDGQYKCYRCPDTRRDTLANSFYCKPLTAEDAATNGPYTNEWTGEVTAVGATYDVFSGAVSMVPSVFRLSNEIGWEQDDKGPLLKMCGPYHQPRKYVDDLRQLDYGIAKYFVPENRARVKLYASKNYNAETVSDRFLCGVKEWNQGDYIDDAGWRDVTGVGTFYGLLPGRHVRINNPNMIKCTGTTNCEPYYANMSAVDSAEFNDAGREWLRGPKEPGEGLFLCGSEGSWGSCLAPDLCSCVDGYTGFDCSQPMCRHLQPAGNVTACQNGGICKSRDTCHCIRTESQLWMDHPEMPKQETGWTGSDCSMPMCTQGIYDPFCTDLPQAPGGEGCYRCANGGNCTAPDKCTCAPGWTGYNCQTPICETIADPLTRKQLGTLYEDKIISFEQDPCGAQAIFFGPDSTPVARGGWKGRKYARGNCTLPNQCTCLCKQFFNVKACHKGDELSCEGPWQDPLVDIRNVLSGRGTEFTFGTQGCSEGFEGNVDGMDRFITCHLTIYVPSDFERSTITYLIAIIAIVFIVSIIYYFVRRRISRRYLLAKIERRRSKRSSEESLMQTSAFRGSKA
jgi:hypothetical protein